MKTILLTGASGFVGQVVDAHLKAKGYRVKYLTRGLQKPGSNDVFVMNSVLDTTTFERACESVDVVCHIAGLAHQIGRGQSQQSNQFDLVNTQFTRCLASAAVASKVSRFILLSSIGVLGAKTLPGQFFSERSEPNPFNAYTLSKLKAEQALQGVTAGSGTKWVILRPPLVHGPNAPGNLHRLKRLIQRGYPLPFANINNQRSMVHVNNLSKFIELAIKHPSATNQLFLVKDSVDYSTTQIILGICKQLGIRPKMFWLPKGLVDCAGAVLGQKHAVGQLYESLAICDQKARQLLGMYSDPLPIQV